MRSRWVVALGVAVLGVGSARAQQPVAPPAREYPCDLPPLLPVPPNPGPLAEVPRPGPAGVEYDHGYNYLPERLPERPRRSGDDVCGPPGRWWVAPSLELAWVPARPATSMVRLRVLDPVTPGGTLPGPLVPMAARSTSRFQAALGLVVGRWFDENNTHGVEASFFLRDANSTFGGLSPGSLVVFPQGTDRGAQVIAFPPDLAPFVVGAFPVTLDTFFATADVNYRRKLLCTDGARLDLLAGYRYAYLRDELYLGDVSDGHDEYRLNRAAVTNAFHGGQIGLAGEVRANRWYAAGSVKVALGAVTEKAEATGAFIGAEAQAPGGYQRLNALAAGEHTEFAVMPTLNVQLGRQVSDRARVFAGYSLNYLSRVARLGDALNPTTTGLTVTDFWVRSISLGAEFRF
ncbi:MAG: BBP7 family outer membrane beta-barrel protein [Planctomycetes bacterium]|nr:BBP7 family outer membrane beta-barrel protein [Planctomycetota bacterium]